MLKSKVDERRKVIFIFGLVIDLDMFRRLRTARYRSEGELII